MFPIIKKFITDLFLPSFCLNCGREGDYLCQDCQSCLPILESQFCLCQKPIMLPKASRCKRCKDKNLDGLYFALSYKNPIIKKLIRNFKYQPYIKDLSKTLSLIIIQYFQMQENNSDFSDYFLIPVPLGKKKMKNRGFNQSEEIAKELSVFFKIPVLNGILIKTKETRPQIELTAEERKENLKGTFSVQEEKKIKGKKIILVDDVYTTGSTMEECARVLKTAGAKNVLGMAIARAEPSEDKI